MISFCTVTTFYFTSGLLLVQRFVHRKILLCWSHGFVEDIIRRRYMANVDSICGIHSDLSELFLETWIEGKQIPFQENTPLKEDTQRFVCHQPLLYSETRYNKRKINELWTHLLQLGKELSHQVLKNEGWYFKNYIYFLSKANTLIEKLNLFAKC